MKKMIHPTLSNIIERMIADPKVNLRYYGEMCQFIAFFEEKNIPTCGVNVSARMNYFYNPKFLDSMNESENAFVMVHELFHLLFDHCNRTKRNPSYDRQMANIAQDMIINGIIAEDISVSFATAPKSALFVPAEYKGEKYFEELYDWLKEQKKNHDKNKDSVSKELQKLFEGMSDSGQTIDEHLLDDCPEGLKKQIIEDLKENLKQRGFETADVSGTLKKLTKTKKDYLKEIKRAVSACKGYSKTRSFKRQNRRQIAGIKGNVKEGNALNCILDTSGSMGGQFEKILSYIYQDDITINLIQCDAQVKGVAKSIRKGKLNRLEVKGGGGTIIQPAVDLVRKDFSKLNTVILTDGYTDSLNLSGLKKVLIITCGKKCETSGNNNVKQIEIEKEK